MSARMTRKRARMEADAAEDVQADTSIATTSAAAEGGPQELREDEEFWFIDGTIILVARGVKFKVYQGPLVDHSPVFRDMLSLPQPNGDGTPATVGDGQAPQAPVVQLSDSPEDLRHLFKVLMPNKQLRPFGLQNPRYHTISAWIRLGHKYQIDYLVEESLKHLRKLYPDTYDAFARRKSPYAPHYAIGIVNLARLTNAHHLLPVAFMECCGLGPVQIIDGFLREDGTHERLALSDLGLCFQAKGRLIEARVRAAAKIFSGGIEKCDERLGDCDEDISFLSARLLDGEYPGLCNTDIFAPWPSLDLVPDLRICRSCRKGIKQAIVDESQSLFKQLPSLVGVRVDGWGKKTGVASTNVA